jgi:streptomycin 3"-adenylyltransferase
VRGQPPHVDDDAVRRQADAVAGVVESVLPTGTLAGLALYGSSVLGGLRPDSDLDLFGIVARRLTDAEKGDLVARLVPISCRRSRPEGWRPVELTLVVHDEVRPWRYPPRFEFQYGEWLREELLSGDLAPWPSANPDVAMLATMVRASSIALRGPHPAELLDPVPRVDLVRAILDDLPSLRADLDTDTRNVLLTLARMWFTVATGDMTGKDAAASWAAERLPPAVGALLERARDGYLGSIADRWDDLQAAQSTADDLVDRIRSTAAAG